MGRYKYNINVHNKLLYSVWDVINIILMKLLYSVWDIINMTHVESKHVINKRCFDSLQDHTPNVF